MITQHPNWLGLCRRIGISRLMGRYHERTEARRWPTAAYIIEMITSDVPTGRGNQP